jgi:acetylglutamate kinase
MHTAIDIQTKTEVLLEALPYIQQFKGSTFVVKFGGSFLDTEQAQVGVATDLVFLAAVGIRVVVVHGGGPAINKAMKEAAIEPVFSNGLRVTDAATVGIVEKTLNGVINQEICDNTRKQGGLPQGVYGQSVIRCEQLKVDARGNEVDIGFVGKITSVNPQPIHSALEKGNLAVVSPVGVDEAGQYYNINADTAASHVATALGARRLVFLCDVPGLLRDPKNPETLISTLPSSQVNALRDEGVIGTGMLPKVESAVAAIKSGVKRVHLIDGRMPHSILLEIFTDKGIGTEITPH